MTIEMVFQIVMMFCSYFFAGVLNSQEDHIAFNWYQSIKVGSWFPNWKWWNKKSGAERTDLEKGILSMFSDGWHWLKFFEILLCALPVGILIRYPMVLPYPEYSSWILVFVLWGVKGIGWEIGYKINIK